MEPKKTRIIAMYDLSDDEFIAFKMKCLINRQNMSSVVKEMIRNYMKEEE